MERRDVLMGGLVLVGTATAASIYKPAPGATALVGGRHWPSSPLPLPVPVEAGPLLFLSADQAALVGAIFDRLIPADAVSIGAVEAGCVTFLDHQLAGPYGKGSSRYSLGRSSTARRNRATRPRWGRAPITGAACPNSMPACARPMASRSRN